eukprot:scaffold16993_cov57-Phaeocystis_antarctica.AAC.1
MTQLKVKSISRSARISSPARIRLRTQSSSDSACASGSSLRLSNRPVLATDPRTGSLRGRRTGAMRIARGAWDGSRAVFWAGRSSGDIARLNQSCFQIWLYTAIAPSSEAARCHGGLPACAPTTSIPVAKMLAPTLFEMAAAARAAAARVVAAARAAVERGT